MLQNKSSKNIAKKTTKEHKNDTYIKPLEMYFLLFQCIKGTANFPYQILLVSFHLQYRNVLSTYLIKTMKIPIVMIIPISAKVIAPIAQKLFSLRYFSGSSKHLECSRSGNVPFWHILHWVSSLGSKIWKEKIEY